MRDKGFEIRDGTKESGSHWKNLTGEKQIILVDFDHTITKKCLACSDGLEDDGVQAGAREALEKLHETYQIWIFTGNYDYLDKSCPVNRTKPSIRKFLRKHKIPFDRILQIKPPAAFIIDDRAVPHTSWKIDLDTITARENMGNVRQY
jgi:hypothetical protein